MSRGDDVGELAATGSTAREIAGKLGISRARVYQIAKANNITLPAAGWPSGPSVARVVTGGIAAPINETTAGTIAEILVMADLLARGWQVYMPVVRHRGYDLIATNDGRIVTVEVRSAKRGVGGALRFQKQPNDKSDVYALVVTGETVEYLPEDWETRSHPKQMRQPMARHGKPHKPKPKPK